MVHNNKNIIPHTGIGTASGVERNLRGAITLISANRNAGIYREKGSIGGVRTGACLYV